MAAGLVQEVGRAVDAGVGEALEFLSALVAARPTLGRETEAQLVFATWMEWLGLEVHELPIPDAISQDPLAGVAQLSYAGRSNLRATTGRRGQAPAVLLNGHIDVVPADPTGWSSDPWVATERGGWVFGRGAGDMKGGYAMTWLALNALRQARPEALEMPLDVLSVIEEECTGNGTLAALRAGVSADLVLLPEPTELALLLGGVGIVWAEVQLAGGAGHANAADRVPSVMEIVGRLIPALTELGRRTAASMHDPDFAAIPEPYNVNVGTVRGGDWPSSVAGVVRLGVRFAHPRAWSSDRALDEVQAVVAACCDGSPITATVTPSGFRAEGYILDQSAPLIAQVQAAHAEVHGEPPPSSVLGSTTDARYYVNTAGGQALCYGPAVQRIHGVDEAVEVASIVDGAKTLAVFLARHAEQLAAGA